MTWDHRIVKEVLENGDSWFSIREAFYNDAGELFAYTEEPADISGESIESLRQTLNWIQSAFDKEILIDGEVKFADDGVGEYDPATWKKFDNMDDFLADLN